jgi:MFS family permease
METDRYIVARARETRIFYGWAVVASAAVGLFLCGAPIVVYSFGVFLKPLTEEFRVGRGAISLAFTLHNIVGAPVAPLAGRLVDRCGTKRVVVPALVLLALVLISALAIGTSLWQLYAFYLALGAFGIASSPIGYGAVISRWFDRRRGLALGLIMLGMGVGTAVMPPIAQRLIEQFGWRMTFALVGCAILVIPTTTVALFLKEDPRAMGLLPDGDQVSNESLPTNGASEIAGLEWAAIWRSKTFWLLLPAFVLAGASVHACVLHMSALLSDRGLTAQQAALGSAVVGTAVMSGRVLSGYLQDRFFAPRVAFGVFALSALGIALLWTGRGGPTALGGAFLVGLGMGAEVDIIAFLLSRYFGLRAYGTAFGFTFGSFILAGGLGGLLMGAGFDRTGSYSLPLIGFFAATVVALALFTRLGPYRFAARREPEPASAEVGSAA